MKTYRLENGKRTWQAVAEVFKPTDDPHALYAKDELMDRYHLSTLFANMRPYLAPMTMYNPFTVDMWPHGYRLGIPTDEEVASFPVLGTPEEVARHLNYAFGADEPYPMGPYEHPQRPMDIPGWVIRFCQRIHNERRAAGNAQLPAFCAGVDVNVDAQEIIP